MEKRKLILSIDFDGTCVEHMYPAIGKPLPGAFESLKRFQEKGDRLILWTCREGMALQEAITFCLLNGIEFEQHNNNVEEHDYAKSRKVYSDLYIDDRMVGGFPGWAIVEAEVDKLREIIASTPSPIVPPAIQWPLIDADDDEIEERVREVYKNLPDRIYNIGDEYMSCFTNKEGKIEFEIELAKLLAKSIKGNGNKN